jgi:alpha-aminoadipate carrier protein LysW
VEVAFFAIFLAIFGAFRLISATKRLFWLQSSENSESNIKHSLHMPSRRHGNMSNAECPECAASIELAANAEVGEILACQDCGTRLEVRSVAPARLEKAPEVQEDWGE